MKFKKASMFLSMALAASMMATPVMAADVSTACGTGKTRQLLKLWPPPSASLCRRTLL